MKTHASLSPTINILLILMWASIVALFLFAIEPRVPLALVIVGGACGAVAGLMQHMSFTQAANGFASATSFMDARRALKKTSWGSRYILWLYFCKAALIALSFLLIHRPVLHVVLGYLGAYVTLMFIRELVTLRDTVVLHRLTLTKSAPM